MKNPWTCNDKAFDAMFTEAAEFITASKLRGTVSCCIFPIEDVDPFADTDLKTEVKRLKILVRNKDWFTMKERPMVGMSVITPDGKKWCVETSDLEQDWWSLQARSI